MNNHHHQIFSSTLPLKDIYTTLTTTPTTTIATNRSEATSPTCSMSGGGGVSIMSSSSSLPINCKQHIDTTHAICHSNSYSIKSSCKGGIDSSSSSDERSLTEDAVRAFLTDYYDDLKTLPGTLSRECWRAFYDKNHSPNYKHIRSSGNLINSEGLVTLFTSGDVTLHDTSLISIDTITILGGNSRSAVATITIDQELTSFGMQSMERSVVSCVLEMCQGSVRLAHEHRSKGRPIPKETRWSSSNQESISTEFDPLSSSGILIDHIQKQQQEHCIDDDEEDEEEEEDDDESECQSETFMVPLKGGMRRPMVPSTPSPRTRLTGSAAADMITPMSLPVRMPSSMPDMLGGLNGKQARRSSAMTVLSSQSNSRWGSGASPASSVRSSSASMTMFMSGSMAGSRSGMARVCSDEFDIRRNRQQRNVDNPIRPPPKRREESLPTSRSMDAMYKLASRSSSKSSPSQASSSSSRAKSRPSRDVREQLPSYFLSGTAAALRQERESFTTAPSQPNRKRSLTKTRSMDAMFELSKSAKSAHRTSKRRESSRSTASATRTYGGSRHDIPEVLSIAAAAAIVAQEEEELEAASSAMAKSAFKKVKSDVSLSKPIRSQDESNERKERLFSHILGNPVNSGSRAGISKRCISDVSLAKPRRRRGLAVSSEVLACIEKISSSDRIAAASKRNCDDASLLSEQRNAAWGSSASNGPPSRPSSTASQFNRHLQQSPRTPIRFSALSPGVREKLFKEMGSPVSPHKEKISPSASRRLSTGHLVMENPDLYDDFESTTSHAGSSCMSPNSISKLSSSSSKNNMQKQHQFKSRIQTKKLSSGIRERLLGDLSGSTSHSMSSKSSSKSMTRRRHMSAAALI